MRSQHDLAAAEGDAQPQQYFVELEADGRREESRHVFRAQDGPVLRDNEVEVIVRVGKGLAQLREDAACHEDYLRTAPAHLSDGSEHVGRGASVRGERAVEVYGDGVEIRGQGLSQASVPPQQTLPDEALRRRAIAFNFLF
ncbi:MAG TPA: hypothetical protein VKM54_15855 [Myxococcota bacterium]|nr:hypothetical protein [Myxococcota bacterium]